MQLIDTDNTAASALEANIIMYINHYIIILYYNGFHVRNNDLIIHIHYVQR